MPAPKQPLNNNGSIRIRFTHRGIRFTLSKLGDYDDKVALKKAQTICDRISLDISSGNFYCDGDAELKQRYHPDSVTITASVKRCETLLELWDKWVETLRLPVRTLNAHYKLIRRQIEKSSPSVMNVDWLITCELASRTFNDRLQYLKTCFEWGVKEGLVDSNPYASIKSRKGEKKAIKPFTQTEVQLILNAFRANQFCSKKSNTPHSHYADFVEFLFLTGTRTSEAIGLQRKHIDFEKGLIEISSVLARSDEGETAGSKRVRKETKTGNVRILPMSERLREMLFNRCSNYSSEALVFSSPNGLPIDDHNFRNRQWKPILDALGLDYRKPYTTRHTLASVAIEQGIPITGVSYLLGHTDTTMVSKTYGHMINRPRLPDLSA